MAIDLSYASVGVVCWMVFALLLDWTVYLQSESIYDSRMTALLFFTSVGFVFAYGILGAIAGSVYGVLACAIRRAAIVGVSRQKNIG